MKEHLDFQPLKDHPELVSESVYAVAAEFPDILVGKIDPLYMNGAALADHYDVDHEDGANCIVVSGKRDAVQETAAVLVPVGSRADLNGLIRQKLNVKRVSLTPVAEVLQATGMEYGSITPIGLPPTWKIFIDSRVMARDQVIVGGGKQISKLRVPTSVLRQLPNVEVVDDLAQNIQ